MAVSANALLVCVLYCMQHGAWNKPHYSLQFKDVKTQLLIQDEAIQNSFIIPKLSQDFLKTRTHHRSRQCKYLIFRFSWFKSIISHCKNLESSLAVQLNTSNLWFTVLGHLTSLLDYFNKNLYIVYNLFKTSGHG